MTKLCLFLEKGGSLSWVPFLCLQFFPFLSALPPYRCPSLHTSLLFSPSLWPRFPAVRSRKHLLHVCSLWSLTESQTDSGEAADFQNSSGQTLTHSYSLILILKPVAEAPWHHPKQGKTQLLFSALWLLHASPAFRLPLRTGNSLLPTTRHLQVTSQDGLFPQMANLVHLSWLVLISSPGGEIFLTILIFLTSHSGERWRKGLETFHEISNTLNSSQLHQNFQLIQWVVFSPVSGYI